MEGLTRAGESTPAEAQFHGLFVLSHPGKPHYPQTATLQTKKEAPQKDGEPKANNKRLALLYALKPYLSPRRCEAIDYFARMSKMGDIIKNIKL